jgi:hypothetical protein
MSSKGISYLGSFTILEPVVLICTLTDYRGPKQLLSHGMETHLKLLPSHPTFGMAFESLLLNLKRMIMNFIKNIALSALLTIGAFGAVMYTSCNKDECKDVVCQNAGTCSGGTCICPTGYEGSRCEILSRDKMAGTYIGSEICDIGTDNYSVTIATNSNAVMVTITNIYNQNFTATGTLTSATSFSFSGSSGATTFSGTGTVVGNQLTLDYDISSPAANNSCVFTGNK